MELIENKIWTFETMGIPPTFDPDKWEIIELENDSLKIYNWRNSSISYCRFKNDSALIPNDVEDITDRVLN